MTRLLAALAALVLATGPEPAAATSLDAYASARTDAACGYLPDPSPPRDAAQTPWTATDLTPALPRFGQTFAAISFDLKQAAGELQAGRPREELRAQYADRIKLAAAAIKYGRPFAAAQPNMQATAYDEVVEAVLLWSLKEAREVASAHLNLLYDLLSSPLPAERQAEAERVIANGWLAATQYTAQMYADVARIELALGRAAAGAAEAEAFLCLAHGVDKMFEGAVGAVLADRDPRLAYERARASVARWAELMADGTVLAVAEKAQATAALSRYAAMGEALAGRVGEAGPTDADLADLRLRFLAVAKTRALYLVQVGGGKSPK